MGGGRMRILIVLILMIGKLNAQTEFLDVNKVRETFTQNKIRNNFLLQNMDKFENQLTLDTVVKMHNSKIDFQDFSYRQILNHEKSWLGNDESRRLINYILDSTAEPQMWFYNGGVEAVNRVTNDYHRRLAIHFIDLYEKLPSDLRNLNHEVYPFPPYFLHFEVSQFYKNMDSEAALRLIKDEFPYFPDQSTLSQFQKKSRLFWNYIDLFYIQNKYQERFVKKIWENYDKLIEIQGENSNPLRFYSKFFSRLLDEKSLTAFEKNLNENLKSGRFNGDFYYKLPTSCDLYFSKL
jgi:hypothetical protein